MNNMKEARDKMAGSVKETTGKVTNNPKLEFEGKMQKGKGKVREVARNITNETEDIKDKVVEGVEDAGDKISDMEISEFIEDFRKSQEDNKVAGKIMIGLGVIAGLYLLKGLVNKTQNHYKD